MVGGKIGSARRLLRVLLWAAMGVVTLTKAVRAEGKDYVDALERAKSVAEVDLLAPQATAAGSPVSDDDLLVNVLRAGTLEVCDAYTAMERATDKAAIDVLVAKGTEAEKRAVAAFGPWSRSATRGSTRALSRIRTADDLRNYGSGVVWPYLDREGGDKAGNRPWARFEKSLASVGDQGSQRHYAAALLYYELAQSCGEYLRGDAKRRKAQADNLCGGFNEEGRPRRACFAFGVQTAALSQVYLGGVEGTRWASLVSVAVPFAGVRVPVQSLPYLSFDFMLYSAFLSFSNANADDAKAAAAARGCARADSEYERLLPCTSNPNVRPYVGLQAGTTLGRSNVGYLNLSLAGGFVNVGNLPGLYPFVGFSLSLPSVTGVL